MGKGRRHRDKRRTQKAGQSEVGAYDPGQFRPGQLDVDKVVGQLGAPVDGWTPQLIYRYAILIPEALCVDWAIMIDVHRVDATGRTVRRRVERIDICHSEIHAHEFRQSDNPLDDQGRRRVLRSISAGDEVTVSREYDLQLALLSREWPERVRRWLDG